MDRERIMEELRSLHQEIGKILLVDSEKMDPELFLKVAVRAGKMGMVAQAAAHGFGVADPGWADHLSEVAWRHGNKES